MNKILKLLGLDEIKYSLGDFENKLQTRYIRNFILDLVLGIFCIIFLVSTKYYKGAMIFILVVMLLLVLHIYAILQLLCGKVYCLEGTVVSDEKKSYQEKFLSFSIMILGRSKLKIQSGDTIYSVPVGHNMHFEPGTKARVYFNAESMTEMDPGEYEVLNPILVTKMIETN